MGLFGFKKKREEDRKEKVVRELKEITRFKRHSFKDIITIGKYQFEWWEKMRLQTELYEAGAITKEKCDRMDALLMEMNLQTQIIHDVTFEEMEDYMNIYIKGCSEIQGELT